MNNPNNNNLKKLIGKITDCQKAKAYSHKKTCLISKANPTDNKCATGCHYGDFYYKLTIACENKPEVKQIMVFKSTLEQEQIWKDIESTKYHGKTYAFNCSQWMTLYRLVNWQLL